MTPGRRGALNSFLECAARTLPFRIRLLAVRGSARRGGDRHLHHGAALAITTSKSRASAMEIPSLSPHHDGDDRYGKRRKLHSRDSACRNSAAFPCLGAGRCPREEARRSGHHRRYRGRARTDAPPQKRRAWCQCPGRGERCRGCLASGVALGRGAGLDHRSDRRHLEFRQGQCRFCRDRGAGAARRSRGRLDLQSARRCDDHGPQRPRSMERGQAAAGQIVRCRPRS